jgi:preprotein translocase subunit YajC
VNDLYAAFVIAQSEPMWIGLILMIVVFYGFVIWNSHKDKQKRKDMLNAVKKNDRVMTIGGIIGTVVTASDTEVTLKVDESANVKITFTRGAIQKVLTEGEKPGDVEKQ